MNIEGATSSGTHTVKPGAGPSSEKTAVGSEFADTFKDQVKLSKATDNPAEISRSAATETHKKQPPHDDAKLQADKSGDEPVVLPGNEAPSPGIIGAAIESALATLSDALEPAKPDDNGADKTDQQNFSDMMAFSGLSFAKPQAIAANPAPSGDNISLDDILQNKAAFAEPAKGMQETKLLSPAGAETAETTVPTDQLPVPEENTPPVMPALQRPLDNKTELTALTRPLNHPGWSKDLGEYIVWLYNKAMPSAEITLNPEHLGPISVRIDVNQDQASILFTTQHAATKEALEASIPKLREMLNNQQLNLADVNISQHPAPNQQHSSREGFGDTPGHREQKIEGAPDAAEAPENEQTVAVKGLLSLYA